MQYRKPARPPQELLELMRRRGLVIGDESVALAFLGRVSYYRLKGYLLHFERKLDGNTTHLLPTGTTFDSVLQLYELDRKLRLLMFEAIERIEICFRSAINNVYALGFKNPHWLCDPIHFVDGFIAGSSSTFHARTLARIHRDIGLTPHSNGETREQEIYVRHYLEKYSDPALPPCWVLAECLSLGVWSQIFDKLSNREGQKRIADLFRVPATTLGSWMHALSVTRNICAHHGRVWNRVFVFKPEVLAGYEGHFRNHGRFYPQAVAAAYLLRSLEPTTKWHIRMKDTLLECPASETAWLGTIPDWPSSALWNEPPLPQYQPKTLAPKART